MQRRSGRRGWPGARQAKMWLGSRINAVCGNLGNLGGPARAAEGGHRSLSQSVQYDWEMDILFWRGVHSALLTSIGAAQGLHIVQETLLSVWNFLYVLWTRGPLFPLYRTLRILYLLFSPYFSPDWGESSTLSVLQLTTSLQLLAISKGYRQVYLSRVMGWATWWGQEVHSIPPPRAPSTTQELVWIQENDAWWGQFLLFALYLTSRTYGK